MKTLDTLLGKVDGKDLEPHNVVIIENFDVDSGRKEIGVVEFVLVPYVVVNKGGYVTHGVEIHAVKHKQFEKTSVFGLTEQFSGYASVLEMTEDHPVTLSFAETKAKSIDVAALELGRQYSTAWVGGNYRNMLRVLDDVALDVVATKFNPASEEGLRNIQEDKQFRVFPYRHLKETANKFLTYRKPGDLALVAHWNRYGREVRR